MAGVLFTRENAAEMARKGAEAKRLRAEAQRKAVEDAFQVSDFQGEQLAHTRAEIRRLRELMSKTTDAKECQAYATAITKMGEWEQKLAMRPGPGQFRPSKSSKPTRQTVITPLEESAE